MLIPENSRRIRPNHSMAYPSRMLFLDTETKQTQDGVYTRHDLLLAWTCYRRYSDRTGKNADRWEYWENPKALCESIASKVSSKKSLYIYGHNIAFDLQVIQFYKYFPRWGWKLDFIYDVGLSYLLVIHKDDQRIKCISTTNYYSYSLKALGDDLGLQKLDVDFDKSTKEELSTYCRQDVAITVKAMERYIAFNKQHDTGKFSMTRASQSFSAFRHRFMSHEILLHQEDPIQKLERFAYYGGRTECFHIGNVPGSDFTFLDVNSMYPSVMWRYLYPVKCVYYENDPEETEWRRYTKGCAIVADVTLSTDDPIYAAHYNGKLVFPTGTFRTGVCTFGFWNAIANNHLVKVHRFAAYEWAPIFREYVDYFYPLKAQYKKEKNPIFTATVKLYLNSLYGKFGQKITEEEKFDIDTGEYTDRVDNYDKVTGERWTDTIMFGTLIRSKGEIDGPNTFTAIPAHVTEYARFYLWSIIKHIGRENVFYCDTDSLAVRTDIIKAKGIALDSLELGALGIDKTGDNLEIFGLKDYRIGQTRKLKGVPLRATEICPGKYTYSQFLGTTSHQRLQETSSFLTREITKSLKYNYNKGIVTGDGSVIPFHFPLN